MSNIKKTWSFFIQKASGDLNFITGKVKEMNRLYFAPKEKKIISDIFPYDTWEKKGNVIYNRRPAAKIKSMVLDCKIRIY